MLDEVRSGRGGERSFSQICHQFLQQFPRAAKTYERLADVLLNEGQVEAVYTLLAKGCRDCWNIDLWAYYLDLLKRKFAELQRVPQTEDIQKERTLAETEFQLAIEKMGWSVDSFALWRVYIDFQRIYPELSAIDLAQKTANLRKVFHRAMMMTFEQMDSIWAEFEQFERLQQGENNPQCEQYLDDWRKKFLHAKSFLRERRRLTDRLDVDRLAVPAVSGSGVHNSVAQQEMQQLECWSAFLAYEMDNYDAANPDAYRPTVHMAFQQCLSCFLYYPEVWIAFAQFEHGQQQARDAKTQDKMLLLDRVIVAKEILDEAIRFNPQSSLLRIALAEIEESVGHVDEVWRILKEMFLACPDGFTFAIYQRFVRRQAGQLAARKLFSETAALRSSMPSAQALELYLAHATLEWQVNHAVDVADRVLDLARTKLGVTTCLRSSRFVQVSVGVLSQLGGADALRALLTLALEDSTAYLSLPNQSHVVLPSPDGDVPQLQRQVELLELFLQSELRFNSTDRALLEYLRDRRHVTKLLLDERRAAAHQQQQQQPSSRGGADKTTTSGDVGSHKEPAGHMSKLSAKLTSLMSNLHGLGHPLNTSTGGGTIAAASTVSSSSSSSSSSSAAFGAGNGINVRRSLFDATFELLERYDSIATPSSSSSSSSSAGVTPSSSSASSSSSSSSSSSLGVLRADVDLRERIRGKSVLDASHHQWQFHLQQQQQQLQQLLQQGNDGQAGKASRLGHLAGGGSASSGGGTGMVPQLLRDFTGKLPAHVGNLPDLDAFCRHIRSVVLPPRPNGPAQGSYKASFSSGSFQASNNTNGNGTGGEQAQGMMMDVEHADEAYQNASSFHLGAGSGTASAAAIDEDRDIFRQRHRQQ
jgi:hypothetical protein